MSTIKDVAKEAGVAVGTVSRYLNGVELKEANRIKVEEAIQKLDFKINPIARGLKTNRTNTIGIVIPDFTDIYATTIVRKIEQKLYEYGYNIFVCDSWGSLETERNKVEILVQKLVDGLIVYPCSEDINHLSKAKDSGIPIVTIDMAVKDFECDQVLSDNINATYKAVEWLIANNHRRIGLINGQTHRFTSGERLMGYERAHADYSLEIDRQLVKNSGYHEKSGYDSLAEFMKLANPPTAVVACNYYTTIGSVKAINHLGIKVPEELSLIGFDDLGLSEVVKPALTVITQPMEEIGRTAAELILSRINGQYHDFPTVARLKTGFQLRDSTKRY